MILVNEAALPVTACYATNAPGAGRFAEPATLFNLNIGYIVTASLAL